jgi:hypothetical protein
MAEVLEKEKLNWPVWIFLIFIVSIIANLAQGPIGVGGAGMNLGCIYGIGTVCIPFSLPVLMLMLPMLAFPLKLTGRHVSGSTLCKLSIVGMTASLGMNLFGAGGWGSWPMGFASRTYMSEASTRELFAGLWWLPPTSAVINMRTGGMPVELGAWVGNMLWYTLFHFSFFLVGLSIMMLFRHRWIDVEKVPFVFPIASWEAIKYTYGLEMEGRPRIPFSLGVIVGLAINIQILMTYLFPWWPDLSGWRTLGISPNGCVPVRAEDPIGSVIVGFMRWNMQPLNYAMAYLSPLNISFGMWFMTLVFMVLAQAAYSLGYYTGALGVSGCCRVLGFGGWEVSPVWGPPLNWSWMCLTGGMIGFVLMVVWQARQYLAHTLRAARGQAAPEIDETREPLSYRSIYIILAISCIFMLAFFLSSGIGIVVGLILLVFGGLFYQIAEAYARGVSGMGFAIGRVNWPSWPLRMFFWPRATEYSVEFITSVEFLALGVDTPGAGIGTWSTGSMYGFRLADLGGLSQKMALKLMVLTFIIAFPIRMVVSTWFDYQVGVARAPMCNSGWECGDASIERWNGMPSNSEIAISGGIGFLIVVGLYYMNSRFPWWPIHPMGFLLSGGQYAMWTGVWVCFLVGWICKYLTLRIGGSKAYENYGTPFIGGTMVGLIVTIFAASVVAGARYFIPF